MSAFLNQSVPVTLEYSWGGFANNSGLLRLEGGTLVLEFETNRDKALGLVANVELALAHLVVRAAEESDRS